MPESTNTLSPSAGRKLGSVSKVDMATRMPLIYKIVFPSISTFETPLKAETQPACLSTIHQLQYCCHANLSSATVPPWDGKALRTLMRCSACQSAGTWEPVRTAPLTRRRPSVLPPVHRGFLCKELRALSGVAARGMCLAHNPRGGSETRPRASCMSGEW